MDFDDKSVAKELVRLSEMNADLVRRVEDTDQGHQQRIDQTDARLDSLTGSLNNTVTSFQNAHERTQQQFVALKEANQSLERGLLTAGQQMAEQSARMAEQG